MASTVNTALRLQEDLKEAAKAKAHEEGRTLTDIIEDRLSEYTGVPRVYRPSGRRGSRRRGGPGVSSKRRAGLPGNDRYQEEGGSHVTDAESAERFAEVDHLISATDDRLLLIARQNAALADMVEVLGGYVNQGIEFTTRRAADPHSHNNEKKQEWLIDRSQHS